VDLLMTVNVNDWRYQYVAILICSQFGEYYEDVMQTKPIVELCLKNLTHQNPKIRYAVAHTLGQYSDDLKP
jgi:importin-5